MSAGPRVARARAHTNIALAKYWGKREGAGNRPATPSLSAGLADLWVEARVAFGGDEGADRVTIDGEAGSEAEASRVLAFVEHVRGLARGPLGGARVETAMNFPRAAGLASSAAAFAALATASSDAAGLSLDAAALSRLARRGSGSAARSLFEGYVELPAVGDDPAAAPVAPAEHFPLRAAVALCERGPKDVPSRMGMAHCAATSPWWETWLDVAARDYAGIRSALLARDLERLAELTEQNCLAMHATALTARPPLVYWGPPTSALIRAVPRLRAQGTPAFFTIDAGANVVVFFEEPARSALAALFDDLGVEALWTRVGGALEREMEGEL